MEPTGGNASNSREDSVDRGQGEAVAECRLADSRGADVRMKVPDANNRGGGTGEHVCVQPVLERQRTQVQRAKAKSRPRVSFAPKIVLVRIHSYDYCRASSGPESSDDDAGSSDDCCSSSSTFSPTEGNLLLKAQFLPGSILWVRPPHKTHCGRRLLSNGDWFRQVKDKPEAATRCTDLAGKEGQEKFRSTIKQHADELVYVHVAPPCGTASRAREIRRFGRWDPQSLRSD